MYSNNRGSITSGCYVLGYYTHGLAQPPPWYRLHGTSRIDVLPAVRRGAAEAVVYSLPDDWVCLTLSTMLLIIHTLSLSHSDDHKKGYTAGLRDKAPPPVQNLTEVKGGENENHLGALKILTHTAQQCGAVGAKLEHQKITR